LNTAKSIPWTRFAFNLVLLRNLQQLCCKLQPTDVCHDVITFLNPRLKPTVRETAQRKPILGSIGRLSSFCNALSFLPFYLSADEDIHSKEIFFEQWFGCIKLRFV